MRIDTLENYLDSKENKSEFETIALRALKDIDLVKQLDSFSFLDNYSNANKVCSTPERYDSTGQYRYYNQVITSIANAYITRNYDVKAKFISCMTKIITYIGPPRGVKEAFSGD